MSPELPELQVVDESHVILFERGMSRLMSRIITRLWHPVCKLTIVPLWSFITSKEKSGE